MQKLRRDFEVLEMKTNETILEYFGRVLTISNQMRSNGEEMNDVKIVEKILRTLTEKYMLVVVSIEESKDIEQMSIKELQSSLIVHEKKFKKNEREEEHALKADTGSSPNSKGCGRGHYSYECPNSKEANYAGFEENEEVMLMIEGSEEEQDVLMVKSNDENRGLLWFLYFGCSNHMCGNKERFVGFDQGFSNTVKLGNNARMTVEGKGDVKIVLNGATYVIKDVYYVPDLKNSSTLGNCNKRVCPFFFNLMYVRYFIQIKA
ncbi:uncharacterized protein LOC128128980 [Lactuca sativa]|uniref:uncharacterized protein LOC128128980 n=1 Tax=Lactuca sativa TaxID=4236 RepID=UPI0022AF7D2B|nr:uncharacterized protein LOC128128980 [Lactuca sativa]